MFAIIEVEEVVGIAPSEFARPLKEAALKQIKEKYEGSMSEELGYVIAVLDADVNPVGHMVPRDGATYHRCKCNLLSFMPKLHEVVEGEVVEITEFGAFVRIGPMDALLHISQIMDDYVSYDTRHSILLGKKTGKKLETGSVIRARIIAISMSGGTSGKIGLTTRQPLLGKLDWIAKEIGVSAEVKESASEGAGM